MGRLLPIRLVGVALCLALSAPVWAAEPGPATTRASDLVWEPIGPVTTSAGMTAVATDPEDTRVIWVGSATSVWVSEDGGTSWNLVLQLSRASGLAREAGDGGEVEVDPDEATDPDAPPEGSDIFEEDTFVDPTNRNSRDDDDGDDDSTDSNSDQDDDGSADNDQQQRFGVTRFRILQDKVWVCTSHGLWSIARSARRTGTGTEVRFGRRMAVNDVARGPDKRFFLATERGLWQLGDDGIGRQLPQVEDEVEVNAIQVVTSAAVADAKPVTRIVLATSRGLRIGDGDRFEHISMGAKDDAGLDDVIVEPNGHIAVAGGGTVYRMDPSGSVVDEAWPVPGASRVAVGRQGQLWTVGSKGAWKYTADEGWVRTVEGLFDRRLVDVAPSDAGDVNLWVVGRAGLWRLVPETAKVFQSQMAALQARTLAGYPDSSKTVHDALEARGVKQSQVDSWVIEERLAWLLPHVFLQYRTNRVRNEDYVTIDVLDRQILDAVEVKPQDDEFRIEARWDLMPALLAAINGSEARVASTRGRARKQQERVREVVLPLWQTWAKKRMEYETNEPASTREALRDLLTLAKLEADLHVYTGGRFPVGGAKSKNGAK